MSDPDPANLRRWPSDDEIYAGLALFFSMYYILSVNPKILAEAHVPYAGALFGTIVVVILGNVTGIFWTRTGLLIAPAIGISTFFKSFVVNLQSTSLFAWEWGLLGCALAGLAIVVISFFSNWRSQIIHDLPPPVRRGASAAIGSLLVKESFDLYNGAVDGGRGMDQRVAFLLIFAGTTTIVGFFLLRARTGGQGIWRLVKRAEFLIVVVVLDSIIQLWAPPYLLTLQPFEAPRPLGLIPYAFDNWAWSRSPAENFVTLLLTGVFAAMISFIIVTDIPGTPLEVLPHTATKPTIEASERGFKNDAIWTLLSPFCGTTPAIFYAENNILRDFEVYDGWAGLVAVILFVLVIPITLAAGLSFEQLIPPFVTIPIVLFIGIYIISASFTRRPGVTPTASSARLEYYIPTAIAVILTPRLGIEYAFPLSVLSYWLVRDKAEPVGRTFVGVTFGAAAVLTIFALAYFVASAPPPVATALHHPANL